jgi:hypothetical protein
MKNRIVLLLVLLPIFLSGCDKENGRMQADQQTIKRERFDMSEEAVAKRWFIKRFENSYTEASDLAGGCIAWATEGWCAYSFAMKPKTALRPAGEFKKVKCTEVYSDFTRFFPHQKERLKTGDITCFECKKNEERRHIASEKNGDSHFVWETFVVK